jgi:hypothetical protein
MAYYLTKPSIIEPAKTVYYHGGNRWTDESVGKVTYSSRAKANAAIANPDGKNGGFSNVTVVQG